MAGMGPVGNVGVSQEEGWKTQPGVQAYRSKVVAEIDDTVRSVGNPTQKSTIELEEHVFQRAKSIEEYLMLGARLVLHMRNYIKKQKDGHVGEMPVGQQQDDDSYQQVNMQPQPTPQGGTTSATESTGSLPRFGSFPLPALQQLLQFCPHSSQQQEQVLAILKSHPQLMAAFIRQRTQQAQLLQQQQAAQQAKQLQVQRNLQQTFLAQQQQQQPQQQPGMQTMPNIAMLNNMQTNMPGNMQVNMQPQPTTQEGMEQQVSLPLRDITTVVANT